MNKKVKIIVIFFLAGTAAALIILFPKISDYYERRKTDRLNIETLASIKNDTVISRLPADTLPSADNIKTLPDRVYIRNVPFVCQAPLQNQESWELHHASCEEAAVIQALYYARGLDSIPPKEAHRIFLDMIAWQEKHFGVHKDIHADSVKMLMTGFLGLSPDEVVIRRKASLDDIRQFIAEGYPVIAPTYGRTLKNPYYTPPGPEYHMVTIIGYTPDRIITHDVGTKRGRDFSYDNERFMKSMIQEGADVLVIKLRSK